jgi:hypothetical protein
MITQRARARPRREEAELHDLADFGDDPEMLRTLKDSRRAIEVGRGCGTLPGRIGPTRDRPSYRSARRRS